MGELADNPIRMTKRALEALSEFSMTLPTGTTPGRRWRRRVGDEWWQGRYGKPIPNPSEARRRYPGLELVTPIFWRRIIVQGAAPRFPCDICLPPRRMR